jgi:hypothetical protein
MTNERKKYIAEQVSAISLNLQGDISHLLSEVSKKRIYLGCDFKDMTDRQIMANLHSIKLELVNISKSAYKSAEAIKRHIESNPDEPDLPLVEEGFQDNSQMEENKIGA